MVVGTTGSGTSVREANGDSNMRQRGKSRAGEASPKPIIVNTRKTLHLVRKVFHALAGAAFAAIYEFVLDRERSLILFGVLFAILGLGETLRLVLPHWYLSRLALKVMRGFARTYEVLSSFLSPLSSRLLVILLVVSP